MEIHCECTLTYLLLIKKSMRFKAFLLVLFLPSSVQLYLFHTLFLGFYKNVLMKIHISYLIIIRPLGQTAIQLDHLFLIMCQEKEQF